MIEYVESVASQLLRYIIRGKYRRANNRFNYSTLSPNFATLILGEILFSNLGEFFQTLLKYIFAGKFEI